MFISIRVAAVATMLIGGIVGAVPTATAEFDQDISCVRGRVAANSVADFDQSFAESLGDQSARMELVSQNTQLRLAVLDIEGNSVCEEVADLATDCRWRIVNDTVYTVRIDNTEHSEASDYSVCLR